MTHCVFSFYLYESAGSEFWRQILLSGFFRNAFFNKFVELLNHLEALETCLPCLPISSKPKRTFERKAKKKKSAKSSVVKIWRENVLFAFESNPISIRMSFSLEKLDSFSMHLLITSGSLMSMYPDIISCWPFPFSKRMAVKSLSLSESMHQVLQCLGTAIRLRLRTFLLKKML